MINILKNIQGTLESRLNITLCKSRHGIREWVDLKKTGIEIEYIFDVGANVGQAANSLHETFPGATIHSIEPVSATYRRLSENFEGKRNLHAYNIGCSNTETEAKIYIPAELSTTASLIQSESCSYVETVQLRSLAAR